MKNKPYKSKSVTDFKAAPIIIAVGVWALYSYFFPFFAYYHYIIATALAAASFFIAKKFIPAERKAVYEIKEDGPIGEEYRECEEILDKIDANAKVISQYNRALTFDCEDLTAESRKILKYASAHEGSGETIKRLVSYYIPTLEKLTESYIEFRENNTAEETVKEIVETIPKMKKVFRNYMEKLLDKREFDISTDIDVLEDKLNTIDFYRN